MAAPSAATMMMTMGAVPPLGLGEGTRGLRPTEAFPDLHHKMSKKIAQLTKVIYHLNSKNEDHQVNRTSWTTCCYLGGLTLMLLSII